MARGKAAVPLQGQRRMLATSMIHRASIDSPLSHVANKKKVLLTRPQRSLTEENIGVFWVMSNN